MADAQQRRLHVPYQRAHLVAVGFQIAAHRRRHDGPYLPHFLNFAMFETEFDLRRHDPFAPCLDDGLRAMVEPRDGTQQQVRLVEMAFDFIPQFVVSLRSQFFLRFAVHHCFQRHGGFLLELLVQLVQLVLRRGDTYLHLPHGPLEIQRIQKRRHHQVHENGDDTAQDHTRLDGIAFAEFHDPHIQRRLVGRDRQPLLVGHQILDQLTDRLVALLLVHRHRLQANRL